jgi:hypothetical protein
MAGRGGDELARFPLSDNRANVREQAKQRRAYWIGEIEKLSGSFGDDYAKLFQELQTEIRKEGTPALLDHLRVCGALPERYAHDSSEEKLYSKYTDALISESLAYIGLKSTVITARADAADVQASANDYSLVADAKAFRLSRTAKNQKDFKVQAMDGWRGEAQYALVVCPIYQLPARNSQIYQQAVARNVCILSYSHLAALVSVSGAAGQQIARRALHELLKTVNTLHPSKSASDYWTSLNKALLSSVAGHEHAWVEEKRASLESLSLAKAESLEYLRSERSRVLRLSHQAAIDELLRATGITSRIKQVEQVEHGNLLGM